MGPTKKKAKKTVTSSHYVSSTESSSSDDESDRSQYASKRGQHSSSSCSPDASPSRSANLSERTHEVLTKLRGRTTDPFVEGDRCIKEFHDYVLTFDTASNLESDGFLCEMGIMMESCTQILKTQMKATQLHMRKLVDTCTEVHQTSEQPQGGDENTTTTELKTSRKKKKQKEVVETAHLSGNVDHHDAVPTNQIEAPLLVQDPVIPPVSSQPDLSSLQQDMASSAEEGSNEKIQNNENLATQQQQPNAILAVLNDLNHLQNLTQSEQSQLVEDSVVNLHSMDLPMETEDTHTDRQLNSNDIPEVVAGFSGEATTTTTEVADSIVLSTDMLNMNTNEEVVELQCRKLPYNLKTQERQRRIEKMMPILTAVQDENFTPGTMNDDNPPKLRPCVHQRRNVDHELIIENNSNEMDVARHSPAVNQNGIDDPDESQGPVLVGDIDMVEVSRQVVTLSSHLSDMSVPDHHQPMEEETHSMGSENIAITLSLQSQPSNVSVSLAAEDEVVFNVLIQSMEAEYNQMVTTAESRRTIMKTLDQLKSTLTNKYNIQFPSTNDSYDCTTNCSQNSEPVLSQTSYQESVPTYSASQEERLEKIRARVDLFVKQECSMATPSSRQTREDSSNLFKERVTTLKERIIKAYRYYSLAASNTPDFIGRIKQFIDEMTRRLRNEDDIVFEINKYEEQFLHAANQEVEDSQVYLHSQSSSANHSSISIVNLDDDEYNGRSSSPTTKNGILTEGMDCEENSSNMNFPLSQLSCSSIGSTSSIWDYSIIRDGKTWVPLYKVLGRLKTRNRMDLVRYFFATICLLNSGNIELYHEPPEKTERSKCLMLENDMVYVCIKKSQSCRANFEKTLDSSMNKFGGGGQRSTSKSKDSTTASPQ